MKLYIDSLKYDMEDILSFLYEEDGDEPECKFSEEDIASKFETIVNTYDLTNKLSELQVWKLGYQFERCCKMDFRKREIIASDIVDLLLLLLDGNDIRISAIIPKCGSESLQIHSRIKETFVASLKKELLEVYPHKLIEDCVESDVCLKFILKHLKSEGKFDAEVVERKRSETKKNIYQLGKWVDSMLNHRLLIESSILNKTTMYCVLADMLYYSSSFEYDEIDWQCMKKKDKKKVVESWLKSYEKHFKGSLHSWVKSYEDYVFYMGIRKAFQEPLFKNGYVNLFEGVKMWH